MNHHGLTGHHLVTAEKILSHPTSHNIEWLDVVSLLSRAGSVTEESNQRFSVTIGAETQMFDRPRGKDIDEQQVVDLRRMLHNAGYTADSLKE